MQEDKDLIQRLIQEADYDRVENYMHLFDRVLLYNIAANLMPKDVLDKTMMVCDKVVKSGINTDVVRRTEFLESNPVGRRAKYHPDYLDGEALRLHLLKQWGFAQEIISNNLNRRDDIPPVRDE